MLAVFGYSVFFFLFFGMLWRQAFRWRNLAQHYAGDGGRQLEDRNLQSAVLLGQGGFNSLKGILKIGVNEKGVSFRVMKPFSLFHAPLFIPFADIRGWKTSWYLDAPSTELEFRRAPEIKIVVPSEQAAWIQSMAGQKMMLRDVPPPRGKAGQGWRAFAVVSAAISLAMLLTIAVLGLSQFTSG